MRIEDWRAEIDEIDNELLRLINRRARLAVKIGLEKTSAGLPLNDPERERRVLMRACRANAGPLDDCAVAKIFRRIIGESRRIQAHTIEMSLAQMREVGR